MQTKRARILLVSLTLLVSIALPATAAAQPSPAHDPQTQSNKSALAVSPAIVEHVLTPDKKKEFTLRVTNLTNFPLPISGTVKNFVTLESVEDPKKQALYDASKWFTITEPDFILQPNQTRTVSISIQPPADAEPGGHYATIYFQPLLPSNALTPATSYLSARVGTLAFLIQPGELEEKLTMQSFSSQAVHYMTPLDFKLSLQNSGNVHLSPNTTVEIRNWFGKKVDKITAPPGIIIPSTTKSISVSSNKSLFFGRYTATATTSWGSDKKTSQINTTFWVIPWLSIAVVITVLLVLFVGFRAKGRWKQAWRVLRGKDHP